VATAIISAVGYLIAKKDMSWKAFPISIVLVFLAFTIILSTGQFEFNKLVQSGLELIWGGGMVGKIAEAEPLIYDWLTFKQVAFSGLGLNLLFTLAGLAILLNSIIRGQEYRRPGRIILLLWAVFTIVLTFGQLRFLYMSTIAMGISISILFFHLLGLVKERFGEGNPRIILPAILIIFLVLTLPTIAEVVYAVTYSEPAIKGDWQESIVWLKENSNATSYFDDPEKNPEYSIMSWWDYGNWIMYMAERPVVANNFQAGWEDAAKFYLSENEENATSLMDARGSKYVFLDHSMAYGKLGAIANWAHEDLTTYFRAEDYSSSEITVIPTQRLFNTTLGKLYYFDAAGTGHFRLIYESRTFLGENPAKAQVKIFEYVPGALIRVRTGADQKVGCVLNMTSNQDRPFIYANQAAPKDGVLEMRVPYSSESRYECRAVDPYLIFSGNQMGVRMKHVNVSEDDVLQGRTIEVAF